MIRHHDTGAVAWCAGRARLGIAIVDEALCALSVFDQREELSDREAADRIVEQTGLDELAARRVMCALREYYRLRNEVRLLGPERVE